MLECGIIFNDYSIKAGREYIYKESFIKGNKNYKYKVLPEYKEEYKKELKSIKETTDYNSLKRYNRLSLAILNFTEERIKPYF